MCPLDEVVVVVVHLLSCVWLFATTWAVAHQAPLSMDFSRQEYSGLPSPSPGDLLTQVSNPCLSCLLLGRQILYHWATWEARLLDESNIYTGHPRWLSGKESTRQCKKRQESGRSPWERNGNPLHCSCLVPFMDRGTWWLWSTTGTVAHGASKGQTCFNH